MDNEPRVEPQDRQSHADLGRRRISAGEVSRLAEINGFREEENASIICVICG